MNSIKTSTSKIFLRYIIVVVVGLLLPLFSKGLITLTVYLIAGIASIVTPVRIFGNILYIDGNLFEIIGACVATSAFYALFILGMSLHDLSISKRLKLLALSFAFFFVMNTFRILILIPLVDASYFETLHWILWHIISGFFIVLSWLSAVKILSINQIPFVKDFSFMLRLVQAKESKRRK